MLRIVLLEVSKESGVGEVLQAGGIICHDIEFSWEVGGQVAVAVLALVEARPVAEEGGRTFRVDSALAHARDCRGVVALVVDGGVGHRGY